MCILCGNPSLVHDQGFPVAAGDSGSGGTSSGSVGAAALSPGAQTEVTYLTGVTTGGTIAATSFWTWNYNNPATYSSTSWAAKWGSTTPGTAGGTVTYWFDVASAWTATEKAALASGLALWSAVANINFALASSAATANFVFYEGTDGSAFEGGPTSTRPVGSATMASHTGQAYISIDTDVAGFGPIGASFGTYGGYPYQTLLHEIGHLIGLGHGGGYNGNVNAATQQFSAYDTRLWTIMSYINPATTSAKYYSSYPVTGTNWGISADGYYNVPTTMMILDIVAAQQIYGTPTSGPLTGGGKVFGFNSNLAASIKSFYDFTVNTSPVVTIWASGTNNTLDLSGWSNPSFIDLRPGSFSSAGGMTNNIGIADSAVIDKAVGGSGADTIIGSMLNNTLTGGAGGDLFVGLMGADTLTGGLGADQFAFQSPSEGVDTIIDFSHSEGDKIWLSRAGFGLAAAGSLAAAGVNFVSGPSALTAAPTILNNNGDLYWDADGTGAGAAVLFAHLNTGASATTVATPSTTGLTAVAIGDFNGDSITDVLWKASGSGSTSEWLMSPSGGLGSNPWTPGAAGWNVVASGDFNADGTTDIMWKAAGSGATSEWLMSKSGGLGGNPWTPGAGGWDVVATGDFNADGTTDIMWKAAGSGATSEWLMSKSGGLGANPATPSANGLSLVATGDFNGDGTDDFLWKNDATGGTSEWLMSKSGGVGANPWTPGANGWNVVGTGDFNSDGTTDIMWKAAGSGATSAWLMSPSGGMGANPATPSANGLSLVATGDFNGDGTDDLLWKDDATGATSEWLMSGSGATVVAGPSAAGLDLVGAHDFNGDVATDVMWRDPASGATTTWLFAGSGLTPGDFLIV